MRRIGGSRRGKRAWNLECVGAVFGSYAECAVSHFVDVAESLSVCRMARDLLYKDNGTGDITCNTRSECPVSFVHPGGALLLCTYSRVQQVLICTHDKLK